MSRPGPVDNPAAMAPARIVERKSLVATGVALVARRIEQLVMEAAVCVVWELSWLSIAEGIELAAKLEMRAGEAVKPRVKLLWGRELTGAGV